MRQPHRLLVIGMVSAAGTSLVAQQDPIARLFERNAVATTDPSYHLLADYQRKISAGLAREGLAVARFRKPQWAQAPAATRLFPGLQFAAISWDMQAAPGVDSSRVHLAGGLATILVIDPRAGSVVGELHNSAEREGFCRLLQTRGIRLRSAVDASRIWQAACELDQCTASSRHVKVSDQEWRLGVDSSDQTISATERVRTIVTNTYYVRVRTEPRTYRVLSWKLEADTGNERNVPIAR